MKKYMILCILVMASIQIGYNQLNAVYVPANQLNRIKIDGETSDWTWVPENYYIYTHQMKETQTNLNVNKNNWNCKIMVAWNDVKNWVYIVAVVRDNICNAGSIKNKVNCFYDNMQFAVNPDNTKGECDYRTPEYCSKVIKATCSIPVYLKHSNINTDIGPSWLAKTSKYLDWAYKITKDYSRNDSILITYELGMALWNNWSEQGAEFSERFNLSSYQTIRLTIAFDDIDKDEKGALWVTSTGLAKNWYKNISNISQFILTPPLKDKSPWDCIYEVLK